VDKVERYEWAKAGDKGKACRIPVTVLKIDRSYQRGEVSERNTLRIAARFSWIAFGSIVVMQRASQDIFVVDGQQRLLAAIRRGEETVPCVLFQSDGPRHEAQAFLELNTHRVKVSAVDKFNAAAKAGNEPECIVARWLASIGLSVVADGKSLKGVCFPAVLLESWRVDSTIAKEAILLQQRINGTEPLCGDVHKAICWLLVKEVDIDQEVRKISLAGGRTAIMRSIRAIEIATVQRATWRTCGLGLLKVINHKRRKKIVVDDTGADDLPEKATP